MVYTGRSMDEHAVFFKLPACPRKLVHRYIVTIIVLVVAIYWRLDAKLIVIVVIPIFLSLSIYINMSRLQGFRR